MSTYGDGLYGDGLYGANLFPLGPVPVIVELFYGGAWHEITADLGEDGVTIVRRRGEPSTCELTLRNFDGTYSARNPRSPLFGLIGRNTPLRVSVQMPGGTLRRRFYGEVAEWPVKWTRKGVAYSPIVASGILRRLGQGAAPLQSPMRRAVLSIGAGLVAYWPLEDDAGSLSFASTFDGHRAVTWVGSPQLAADETFAASTALPTVQDATLKARVPAYTSTESQVRWLAKVPASTPNGATLVRATTTGGTLSFVEVRYSTGGALTVQGFDRDGLSVGSATYGLAVDGKSIRYSLELQQSGSNVAWTLAVVEVGALGGTFGSGTFTGVTLGRVSAVDVNPGRAALADLPIGHLTVEKAITSVFDVSADVLIGHFGEKAGARIERLCTENGIPAAVLGGQPFAETMAAQTAQTLVDLLDEAAELGQGMLYETRDAAGFTYRTVESSYSQTPALDVAYVDNLLRPFEPVDDDATTRNKVTVTRAGGSSATVEAVDGPLSTAAAPDGVGIYDEAVTLPLAYDSLTRRHAAWRVARGTIDEPRWPAIGLDLGDSYWTDDPALTEAALAVELGDLLVVSDLPAWLPPDDVRAVVVGYEERMRPPTERGGRNRYELEFECVPGRSYDVAVYGPSRYSTAGTLLAEDLDTTETDVTVTVGARAWGHDDGDYTIVVGGEDMLVTAVTAPAAGQQTFTVVRSVNGVVKTHTTGAAVDLAEPKRYGL